MVMIEGMSATRVNKPSTIKTGQTNSPKMVNPSDAGLPM